MPGMSSPSAGMAQAEPIAPLLQRGISRLVAGCYPTRSCILAAKLQRDGTGSFDASWNDLMDSIASKSELLTTAHSGS
jgi:hypothetical protein